MPSSYVMTPRLQSPPGSKSRQPPDLAGVEEPITILPLTPRPEPDAAPEPPTVESLDREPFAEVKATFPVGSQVTLQGLVREHYNGRKGVVIGHDDLTRKVTLGVAATARGGGLGRKKMKVEERYLELRAKGDGEISQQVRDEIALYAAGGLDREESMTFEAGDAKEPSTVLNVGDKGEEGGARPGPMGAGLGRCANIDLAILEWQLRLRIWYGQSTIQWGVTILILINFIFILLQNTHPFLGQGSVLAQRDIMLFETVMTWTDWFFLVIFTLELCVNLFAHWWNEFWRDSWNIFDFLIITFSWAMKFTTLPASAIRVIRALRVTRLIGKLTALRIIVNTLTASLPAMGFLTTMLIFIIAIFSIVCINMFKDIRPARCAAIVEDKDIIPDPYWACKYQIVPANSLAMLQEAVAVSDVAWRDPAGADTTPAALTDGALDNVLVEVAGQARVAIELTGGGASVLVTSHHADGALYDQLMQTTLPTQAYYNGAKRTIKDLKPDGMLELDLENIHAENNRSEGECLAIRQMACYEDGSDFTVSYVNAGTYTREYWQTLTKKDETECGEAGFSWRMGQVCTIKDRYVGIIESDDWGGVNRFANLGQAYFALFTAQTFEAFPGYVNQVHQYHHGFTPNATLFLVLYLIITGIIFMEFYQTILLDKMMEAKEFVMIKDRLDQELLADRKLQIKRHITRVHRVRLDTLHPYNASSDPLTEKDATPVLREKLDKIGKEYHQRLPAVADLKKAKRWDDKHMIEYEDPASRFRAMCELQTRRGATEEEDSLSIPPEEVLTAEQIHLEPAAVSVEMPALNLELDMVEGSVSVPPAEAEAAARRAVDPPSYKAAAAAKISSSISREHFREWLERLNVQFDQVKEKLDNMEGKKYGGSAFTRAG